jgi:hypothetical protein
MTKRFALTLLTLTERYTEQDLKSAFKREAYKWHPDRNNNPDATNTFRNITEAYNILLEELKKPKSPFRRSESSEVHYKKPFHRPTIDLNDPTYQKIKGVAEIIWGKNKVAQVEGTVQHTEKSLEEIFDLLGIER